MAARQDYTLLLDQLQEQVNLVLENTGRLFAAAYANPKIAPVAQSAQLRRILPSADIKFHDALDKLEDELQLAKAVMCRDFAVWQEQNGKQVPEIPMKMEEDTVDEAVMADSSAEAVQLKHENEPTPGRQGADEDTSMQDANEQHDSNLLTESKDVAPESNAEANNPTNSNASEKESISNSLHLNTVQAPMETDNQDNSDDRPPDTTDLDSLFNDALSASGNGNSNEGNPDDSGGGGDNSNPDANANNPFTFDIDDDNTNNNDDAAGTSDFDFDSFSANLNVSASDNNNNNNDDNVSSLLPGLEDYANMPATGGNSAGLDFDDLFGSMDEGGQEGGGENGDQSQQQRDSTFNDLFDLGADFDAGNGGSGGGDGGDDVDFGSFFNNN